MQVTLLSLPCKQHVARTSSPGKVPGTAPSINVSMIPPWINMEAIFTASFGASKTSGYPVALSVMDYLAIYATMHYRFHSLGQRAAREKDRYDSAP